MSRRLTHEVGMSRHPLLMADPIARDVLWWMADAAQERNDCQIILSVPTLAENMGRGVNAVRFAQERLQKAGLLVEVGRGDYNKRVKVLRIGEDVLNGRNRVITHEATPRDDSESDATNPLRSRSDHVAIALQPRSDHVATTLRSRSDHVPLARARFERELEPELEPDQSKRAGADAPAGTLGDEVEVLNAATALRNAAALAPRRGAPTRRPAAPVEPSIPEPEPVAEPEPEPAPEPRKPSPGEVRVTAAVESLLSEIGADGQPERTLKLWRAKLRSRLTDDGVSEEAVAKRAETIRAAWGNLQRSAWHVEHGCATRGHLFAKTLRSGTELDAMAVKRSSGPRTPVKPWAAVGAVAPVGAPEPHGDGLTDAERAEIEAETEAMRRATMPERKAPAPVVALHPVEAPSVDVSPAGQAKLAAVFDLFSMGGLKAGPSGTKRV